MHTKFNLKISTYLTLIKLLFDLDVRWYTAEYPYFRVFLETPLLTPVSVQPSLAGFATRV